MKIKEFCALTGLSRHTIRYYEKIGVLKRVARSSGGYREFGDDDIAWIEFVMRLKGTGMPVKNIRQYADLLRKGDETMAARLAILESHRSRLLDEMDEKRKHLKKIQEKIEFYKKTLG